VFLDLERGAASNKIKEPRRPVIYAAYSLVLLVAGLVVGWAMWPATVSKLGQEKGRRRR
jgi:hypothetical protein